MPCGNVFCRLLGVFNKKFGIGSMALDKLPHLKIPAVRIIVGKQSGSRASLAEICVAARSWSSAPQTFLVCGMKEQFLQKYFSGCSTYKKKVNAC